MFYNHTKFQEDGMVQAHNAGIVAALSAAALFGAGNPLAKLLLAHTNPWLLT